MRHELKIKRVYEEPDKNDGRRILVDRLWPRGLTKEKANVDLWLKDIAPSTELRKWFGHDPKKWRSFRGRYQTELKHHGDQLKLLKSKAKEGPVTLVYGARDQEHNEAVVLKQFLERRNRGEHPPIAPARFPRILSCREKQKTLPKSKVRQATNLDL